jgi:predicted RNase H-like HicB family nuclease
MAEIPSGDWQYPRGLYRCAADLTPDSGGYSAACPQLPGVASQGDTMDGALVNLCEALKGALDSYRAEGRPVPWRELGPVPAGAVRRWLGVQTGGQQ